MTLWIGTSGWQYDHWKGRFYPDELAAGEELAYYGRRFRTVEVNATFYHLPEAATFAAWRRETPDDFLFAIKASRYLTHMKKLKDPGEPVARLVERARELGEKLGPVLLQLPPRWRADPGRLAGALAAFPAEVRLAVEVRDESWFSQGVRRVLEERNAPLVLADRGSRLSTPEWRTADWGYLRFHGGRASPAGGYGRTALASRAELAAALWGPAADVYAYFNNDGFACALRDARGFAWEAARRGLHPTRVAAVGEVCVGQVASPLPRLPR